MLYWVPGQGVVDDQTTDMPDYGSFDLPDGTRLEWGTPGVERLPEYRLSGQFSTPVQWRPDMGGDTPQGVTEGAPGYISALLQTAEEAEQGRLDPLQQEYWQRLRDEALAVPTRDVQQLRFSWAPEEDDWSNVLGVSSPDLGAQLLGMRSRIAQGTATPHERDLFNELRRVGSEWEYRANVPQASDAFTPLGDNLFGALAMLGTGVTGGLAAAPLLAGGAGLATTLGSLGTLAGTAGGWASTIGGATGQDWLQKLGLGLGLAGGLAGAAGGIGSALGSGLRTVGDAARLASGTSKLLSTVGSAANQPGLKQAAGYLGMAGSLGRLGGGTGPLLSAAQQATQGGPMEMDWTDWDGGDFPGDYSMASGPGDSYSGMTQWGPWGSGDFPGDTGGLSLEDQVRQAIASRPDLYGSASQPGGWGSTVLGALGSVGKFLGSNASWLGPAASALGGLGAGAIGSNASSDAARLQADALNRGLDLQTAQWLQIQANQAPWLEAGRDALGELRWRMGHEEATPPELRGAIRGSDYALPGATPGWSPSTYAGYTPTDVPSAAGYRYTPGGVPQASQFRYTPGAVPTLSGKELLANDPGVQFRLDEGRNALEASAAARGGLLSGPALAALQRQGQELSSQEYGQAWNRASQQAQLREQWSQMASQLGWSQAESETRLREMLAQQASSQNWQQALQEAQSRAQQQQFGWTSGFQAQSQGQREREAYDTSLYNRLMQQNQLQYGRDVYTNETDEQRRQQLYSQQLAEMVRQWNQASGLAQTGQLSAGQLDTQGAANTQQMTNLLSQLGTAQAGGALGGANSWMNALSNVGGAVQGYAGQQAYMQGLQSILAGLNR